jgi:hypothetical protein
MNGIRYVTLFFITFTITARQGCLTDRIGINQNMHVSVRPVTCYCPCDRYPHDPRRNTCVRCGHAHADTGFATARNTAIKQPWELLGME